jgi:hypothetical protein
MEDESIFTESDLVVIRDAVSVIRNRPEMYLGVDIALVPYSWIQKRVLGYLVSDLTLMGATPVTVDRFEGIIVVRSPHNWLEMGCANGLDVETLFRRIVPIPEAGPNSMRSEILLSAFVQNIMVLTKREVTLVKGHFVDTVVEQCREYEPDTYKVAFS